MQPGTEHEHVADAQWCCWACWEAAGSHHMFFIVCRACGNKRCPRANDHDWDCTGSNEPGQVGSAYEHGSGAASARRWARAFGQDDAEQEER